MRELENLRARIDKIDGQIVSLLNQRAEIAKRLGKMKKLSGKEIFDASREKIVFDRIKLLNEGPLSEKSLEKIYQTIIRQCREIQK
ncbi:MAG: chorismate mutase [Calditrichaeota bacterium]|nr:chorismate mutase [Calditrichota bacterium]